MPRALHRYMDSKLRYGTMVGKTLRNYKRVVFNTSGTLSMPRGDFRFLVFGAGGGGAFYTSVTTQNSTGVFTGNFGVASGGHGGLAVFDVHIPHHGVEAAITTGSQGAGKTANSTTAAGTGGQSKVVISSRGITVTANGGTGAKAGGSKANCVPGTGGSVSFVGVDAVHKISGITSEIGSGTNADSYVAGRHFATKLDFSRNAATSYIWSMFSPPVSAGDVNVFIPSGIGGFNTFGSGGQGVLAVFFSSNKFVISGVEKSGWIADTMTFTEDGGPGGVIIERL